MQNWSAGGLILDVYDDLYLTTIREDKELLEKVGSMQVLTPEDLKLHPDNDFGLIILASPKRLRKYPVYDEQSTTLSKKYFEKNAHKLTGYMRKVAAKNILRACTLYGINGLDELEKTAGKDSIPTNVVDPHTPDVDEHSDKRSWEAYSVAYLSDDKFAHIKTAGSKTYRMYPIDTPQRLRSGMGHFEAYHEDLRPLERVKIANAMVRKAEEFTMPIENSVVEKYASTRENPNFNLYIKMRKEALGTDEESTLALDGLIEKKANFRGQSFGRALELFDETLGLDSLWDIHFPDPYATCFSVNDDTIDAYGIIKSASDEEWIKKLAENPDKLSSVFNSSSAEEFKQNPVAVFNSLPDPTKSLLRSLAQED